MRCTLRALVCVPGVDIKTVGYFVKVQLLYLMTVLLVLGCVSVIGKMCQTYFFCLSFEGDFLPRRAAVSLLLVPLLCWLTLMFLASLTMLYEDVLRKHVLERTRKITVLIYMFVWRRWKPSARMKNVVDLFVIVSSVAAPLLSAVIHVAVTHSTMQNGMLTTFVVGYIRGGFILAAFLVFLNFLCELLVASNAKVGTALTMLDAVPSDWSLGSSFWDAGQEDWSSIVASQDSCSSPNLFRALFTAKRSRNQVLLVVLMVLVLTLNVALTTIHKNSTIGLICFLVIAVALLQLEQLVVGRVVTGIFKLVGYSSLSLSAIFFFVALQTPIAADGEGTRLTGGMNYTPVQKPSVYPICVGQWGHHSFPEEQRLTALDLSILASAVYHKSNDSIASIVQQGFGDTSLADAQLVDLDDYDKVGRMGVFRFPSIKVQVLSVRGTLTERDILKDLDLYTMSFLLELVDTIIPIIFFLSTEQIQHVFYLLSVYHFLEDPVLQRVFDKLRRIKEEGDSLGYVTVGTGHSLGGAFAVLGAARLNIPAVVFSSPGYVYIAKAFGIDLTVAKTNVVNVQPEGDVVVKIDSHVGAVQEIMCTESSRRCHALIVSMCELLRNCGDPRGRVVAKVDGPGALEDWTCKVD
ncbi:unnamed protein product [Prorocentrum cordatum]|uniref:Fungal lipase-type domain-containing protein n=1 Tax=Prorocentrum cordatum TaxID=2364126 RepID=A0ABN9VSY4_9DINO|nr:unnamed protein product [Polarella glacialis]